MAGRFSGDCWAAYWADHAAGECEGRGAVRRIRALFFLLASLAASTSVYLAQAGSPDSVRDVIQAARSQIGKTIIYDGSYKKIAYPGGDVPIERGVCTDVMVRAFRAVGIDLQVLVHEDMKAAFSQYPKAWGLAGPDANIDHRRVPNLAVFFRRHGLSLRPTETPSDYFAGDIVTWMLPSGYPHIGLVSDAWSPGHERPLVIHNIGQGTQEEDVLFMYHITGHYRYFGQER